LFGFDYYDRSGFAGLVKHFNSWEWMVRWQLSKCPYREERAKNSERGYR